MTITGSKPAALFAAVVLALSWTCPAAGTEATRTITVRGSATVQAPPDMAEISVGAVSRSEDVETAMAENSAAVANILMIAEEFAIAPADRQTRDLSVAPVFEDNRDGGGLPGIIGYEVSNIVALRLRELSRLGELLDRLTRAGANRMGGIHFGVSDREALLQQARREAIADARARAVLYAEQAGVTLGRVIGIAEDAAFLPRAGQASAFEAVPVAVGTRAFSASVTVRFAIGDDG